MGLLGFRNIGNEMDNKIDKIKNILSKNRFTSFKSIINNDELVKLGFNRSNTVLQYIVCNFKKDSDNSSNTSNILLYNCVLYKLGGAYGYPSNNNFQKEFGPFSVEWKKGDVIAISHFPSICFLKNMDSIRAMHTKRYGYNGNYYTIITVCLSTTHTVHQVQVQAQVQVQVQVVLEL